jgi:CRP-like cAMP-binding protein
VNLLVKVALSTNIAKAMEDSIILCIDEDALRDLPGSLKDKCKDAIIEGMATRIIYLTNQIQQLS